MTYSADTTSSTFAKVAGAPDAWAQGYLGQGVGVAVIDSGTAEMNDLHGRIVFGPDLSGEGTTLDSYGHGTVMAGIIAGGGDDSASDPAGAHTGVAPKATIVSVKAAGATGGADVSTMLQAMHWVSAYAKQFNIRVLNLSWGTHSTQDPTIDPLNYAVERLWREGILVVVAAGNDGPLPGTITKPGDDPVVLTVGAFDDAGTVDGADDTIATWASRGPTAAGLVKPDLVSPGRTLISPRAYGSHIEVNNPTALVQPSYIKGSGTSQATAVTSGLAALLLSAHPEYTPDQVKALLIGTTSPIPGVIPTDQGAGRTRLAAAMAAQPGPSHWQNPMATGLGSIEKSRGGVTLKVVCDGVKQDLVGEIDARCEGWNPQLWTGSAWTGSAWTGSAWTGSAWTGSAWTGSAWTGSAWTGSAWTGGTWTGSAWTGSAWTGSAWTGSAWTGSAWTGSTWSAVTFTSSQWTSIGFQTAFWGRRPKCSQLLPGEPCDPDIQRGNRRQ
jgi:serine protease AprX